MIGFPVSPNLVRWFQTINLNLQVFALGCVFGLTGATLLDLGDVYDTSPKSVSYIITTRGLGSIVSCLLASLIFRLMNVQHVMIISVLASGVCLGLTPVLGDLTACHAATFIVGACIGLMETGCNCWIIAMWKEKSGTVFQFLNFWFGFGGVVAPFIAEPFLSKIRPQLNKTSPAYESTDDLDAKTSETRVYLPYLILAGVFLSIASMMIFALLLDGRDVSPIEETQNRRNNSARWELLLVEVYCGYVFVIVALEQTFISMISVYVVENDKLSFNKSASAYVSAVFWIAFTAARVVATMASLRFKPATMLLACHGICLTTAFVLVMAGGWCSLVVWVCSGLIGAGVSPMFATSLTFMMTHIEFNHSKMSFVMLFVCVGGLVPPLLVGPFLETYPEALLYVNLIISCLAALLMAALLTLTRGRQIHPRGTG